MKSFGKRKIVFLGLSLGLLPLLLSCGSTEEPVETLGPAPEEFPYPDIRYTYDGGTVMTPENSILLESATEPASTYKNPLMNTNPYNGDGFGDPFVMRWNGLYYLYCSANGDYTTHVWTSTDLVNWTYGCAVTENGVIHDSFAPEVVYYNGYFYMYSSPEGRGHYVYKSDSPMGPFKKVSGNVQRNIDGSMFIDDDGKWYFYFASGEGIMVSPMTSPTEFGNSVITGADMAGWTEGPGVFKFNGMYFLTYTGNHVLSKGYRVDYATSTNNPKRFTAAKNNPILLNSESPNPISLGHSSNVIGPDLDSMYIVYHSRPTNRHLCIDRLAIGNAYMTVVGPTGKDTEAPSMPDLYSSFDSEAALSAFTTEKASFSDGSTVVSEGGYILSKTGFEGDFTMEINFRSLTDKAGAVFCFKDWKNYGEAFFEAATGSLIVKTVEDGVANETKVEIAKSFDEAIDFSVLQLMTVKKCGNKFTFFFNNRTVTSVESALTDGYFGVSVEKGSASVGFVGYTASSDLNSLKNYRKAVTGENLSIYCVEEGLKTEESGKYTFVCLGEGQTVNYLSDVQVKSGYTASLLCKSDEGAVLELYYNGEHKCDISVPAGGILSSAVSGSFELEKGYGYVSFKVKSGSVSLVSHRLVQTNEPSKVTISGDDFDNLSKRRYVDGSWDDKKGYLKADGNLFGKILFTKADYGDYVVEATLTNCTGTNGILFRARNCAEYITGEGPKDGKDFVQGYYLAVSRDVVTLYKMNYNRTELVKESFDRSSEIKVKITCVGANIRVEVNGKLLIDYTDTLRPWLSGGAGFKSDGGSAKLTYFKLYDVK